MFFGQDEMAASYPLAHIVKVDFDQAFADAARHRELAPMNATSQPAISVNRALCKVSEIV
jgi:hypothetical protein